MNAHAPLIGLTAKTRRVEAGNAYSQDQTQDFTYRFYTRAVLAAGGLPVALPACLDPDRARRVVDRLDALLLTGGEADVDPARYGRPPDPRVHAPDTACDAAEMAALGRAVDLGLPVLGICRGLQVVNVFFGGALYAHLPEDRPGPVVHDQEEPVGATTHSVALAQGSALARLSGARTIEVNSFHHQGVERVGNGLLVTATAPDGLPEGLELPGHPFLVAVQWHPEGLCERDPAAMALFAGLVRAARERG